MATKLVIAANKSAKLSAEGRFLLLRSSTGALEIKAQNRDSYQMLVGESLQVDNDNNFIVKNLENSEIIAVFESVDYKVQSAGNAAVTVANKPIIQRIEEAIQVNAQATVENGTMHVIASTSLADLQDKTIAAKTKSLLIGANPNRKAVLIQVISDEKTELRVGTSNVSSNRGIFVAGSKLSPAIIPIETTAELHAYNDHGTATATIAVTEVLK